MKLVFGSSHAKMPRMSNDEMVDDLCGALLEHLTRARNAGQEHARVTQFDCDIVADKIDRCERWLRALGKQTVLANVYKEFKATDTRF